MDAEQEPAGVRIDRDLNLKGRSALHVHRVHIDLEEMEEGQVLRVIVDYPPAACDVPRSLKSEATTCWR